jgi:uncharacterized protein YdcH (DUF465 family)
MHKLLLIGLLALGMSGCANTNSVYRDFKVDDGVGAMVDVKQRAVIASKRQGKTIVCAEPSPDALSAYAAELSAKADTPGKTAAQFAAAFQESASYIGLRTQAIQLLRDSMYRLCEAYMSGGIDETQYQLLLRRYQKNMVALLTIEQLTGAIRVPPVTINTQGSAEAARSLSSLAQEIKLDESKISDLDEKIKTLNSELTGAEASKKASLEAEIAKLTKEKTALEADKAAVEKARETVRDVAVSGSATATVNTYNIPSQRSDEHIQAVAKAVAEIAARVLDTDDIGALCWSHLVKQDAKSDLLVTTCKQYFDTSNQLHVLGNNLTVQYIEIVQAVLAEEKSAKPDQEKIKTLLAMLNGIEKKLADSPPTATAPITIQTTKPVIEAK